MRLRNSLYIIVLSLVVAIQDIYGTHLVGGDVTYEFVSFNQDSTEVTFDIFFNMYRDSESGGAQFDGPNAQTAANFGVYRQELNGEWEFYRALNNRSHSPIEDIEPIDDPCREEPTNVGVESATYTMRITFEVGDRDYMVAYQRCCRNRNASNVFAEDEGVVFDVIISSEAQKTGNNSPVFSEYPPIFICTGFNLDIDVSGFDVDGDSLSYSFCTPFTAGGPGGGTCDTDVTPDLRDCRPPFDMISFRQPYSAEAPMGGDPIVSINPVTGQLSGVPLEQAQYIIGLCIEEWRDGVLIGTIRRDFQFNALSCTKEISANLVADEVEIDNSMGVSRLVNIIKACGDSTVFFESTSFGNQLNSHSWLIESASGEVIFEESGAEALSASVLFPELGEYFGTLIINENFDCPDTAFFTVERLPEMITDYEFEITDSCYLAPIQFKDMSWAEQADIIRWQWDFDNGDTDTIANPSYLFDSRGTKRVRLISFDTNGCRDTSITFIDYDPPHDEVIIDTPTVNLCFGDSLRYFDEILFDAGDYDKIIQYVDTGCDSIESSLALNYWPAPTYDRQGTILCPGESFMYQGVEYSESGIFTYETLSIEHGCDSVLHEITIEIDKLPVPVLEDQIYVASNQDFTMPLTVSGPYSYIQWTPTDGLDCMDCVRPTVNFDTDTTYVVEFFTEIDCRVVDSISLDFKVVPDKYYLPTIISSQAQLVEDRFFYLQTLQEAFDNVTYDLRIYDRWGGLMHERVGVNINDRLEGWSAYDRLPGSYSYYITVHEFFKTENIVGTFVLAN